MSQPPNSEPTQRLPRPATGGGSGDTVLLTTPGEASERTRDTSRNGPAESASSSAGLDPESSRLAVLRARYDILGDAGHGSMGNVYKARDRETGEIVALKLLKPEISSDQTMMERFKNELLFARKITHKNVCRMYDFNRIDGVAYTSMEFVHGESLRSVLNRFTGLPVRKAIGVALQVCSGLKEAHAQGIVHRDLKPENVMIDAQGNVKIMDFGIARSMEAATRLTGSMMGTPAYMAPEQVSGKTIDYRTDIYSLGLMLYEMFTGAQACQADTPVAAALKQIRETPPPPHQVDPTIPVAIERTILKCLEKDPAKRFQSVAELEKALSAPGVTATASGLASPSILSTPTPLPAPVSMPSPPAVPVPRALTSSAAVRATKRRRSSALLWALVGALVVIAGLAGAHWANVAQTAKLTPPPPSLPAPKPPPLASKSMVIVNGQPVPKSGSAVRNSEPRVLTKTKAAATPDSVSAPEAPRTTPAPLSEGASKPAINAGVFPPVERAVKKSARQIELEKPPQDVQQRANKAFGEAQHSANPGGSATKYVWVGRYERKQRAESVVQKIRTLGVPVRAVARSNWQGQFWVVIAGPFTQDRVPDVLQWLQAQGFFQAREVQPAQGLRQRQTLPQ
jgi:serine/threonine protein kinase